MDFSSLPLTTADKECFKCKMGYQVGSSGINRSERDGIKRKMRDLTREKEYAQRRIYSIKPLVLSGRGRKDIYLKACKAVEEIDEKLFLLNKMLIFEEPVNNCPFCGVEQP